MPEWRNWQTRWTQNPVPARASRFDSGLWYFMSTTPTCDLFGKHAPKGWHVESLVWREAKGFSTRGDIMPLPFSLGLHPDLC
jgi:hypothetical protein